MRRLAWIALALFQSACRPEAASITIENARTPAPPPGAPVAAAYMDITARHDDVLAAAETPLAQRTEMHGTVVENDMMQMRPLATVALPAGKTVSFAPGGLHFMLSELRERPQAGSTFPLKLRFQQAGEIEVQIRVHAPGEQ
jgi:copper(I)-binding protein